MAGFVGQNRQSNEQRTLYWGKYRGLVRDVNDPENRGRIQAFVPQVMGTVDNKSTWTPWALPCFPPGQLTLPALGDGVWIEFELGRSDSPVWTGCFRFDAASSPSQSPNTLKESSKKLADATDTLLQKILMSINSPGATAVGIPPIPPVDPAVLGYTQAKSGFDSADAKGDFLTQLLLSIGG